LKRTRLFQVTSITIQVEYTWGFLVYNLLSGAIVVVRLTSVACFQTGIQKKPDLIQHHVKNSLRLSVTTRGGVKIIRRRVERLRYLHPALGFVELSDATINHETVIRTFL